MELTNSGLSAILDNVKLTASRIDQIMYGLKITKPFSDNNIFTDGINTVGGKKRCI